ncbi:MAG TPA: hypothetical protein PKD00_00020 [Burkholderiales bacterium]|nr:hypothetical protein [Burkholderiales bacterium]
MQSLKEMLTTISCLTLGLTISSLWFSDDMRWKYYLPICIFCIIFQQAIDRIEKKYK